MYQQKTVYDRVRCDCPACRINRAIEQLKSQRQLSPAEEHELLEKIRERLRKHETIGSL